MMCIGFSNKGKIMLPDLARHTEKLMYFYELIQEGSLQGTSRKLRLSAATLSYNLRELESAAGATLFERTKKGLIPTPAGERLAQFCRKLYRELDEVQLQLQDASHPERRKIRFGTFSSIAIYFWPLVQEELKKDDSLSLSISTRRSREILEALMKRDVDIAITVGSLRHADILRHELYHDSYGFYAREGLVSGNLSPEDLRSTTLLYLPDAEDEEGRNLRSHVHRAGLKFKDEYELDSFDVITAFVKKGYGVGILPVKVAQNLGAGLRRVSVPGLGKRSFGDHCFYLSYRKDLGLLQSDLRLIKEAAAVAVTKLQK